MSLDSQYIFVEGKIGTVDDKMVAPSGAVFIRFSFATNIKEHSGGEKVTTWFSTCVWNEAADALEKYLVKGAMVSVRGDFVIKTWYDKKDKMRYMYNIKNAHVNVLGFMQQGYKYVGKSRKETE